MKKIKLITLLVAIICGVTIISAITTLSVTVENALASIDGKYTKVATYDPTATPAWQLYIVGESGNDLTEIDSSKGYWIYINDTNPVTLSVVGTMSSETQIQLSQGWNIIGYPSLINRSVQDALSTIDGNYTKVAAYNPAATPAWQLYIVGESGNDLTELSSGFGYWIYMTNEDTLIISG